MGTALGLQIKTEMRSWVYLLTVTDTDTLVAGGRSKVEAGTPEDRGEGIEEGLSQGHRSLSLGH